VGDSDAMTPARALPQVGQVPAQVIERLRFPAVGPESPPPKQARFTGRARRSASSASNGIAGERSRRGSVDPNMLPGPPTRMISICVIPKRCFFRKRLRYLHYLWPPCLIRVALPLDVVYVFWISSNATTVSCPFPGAANAMFFCLRAVVKVDIPARFCLPPGNGWACRQETSNSN